MKSRSRRLALVASGSALALAGYAFVSQGVAAQPDLGQRGQASCTALGVTSSSPATQRQADFAAAARRYGVPVSVLLAVSYLESRWDDHAGAGSTAGGYGPMHLTDVSLPDRTLAKGDGSVRQLIEPASLHTISLASRHTGLSADQLRINASANICGGAAVLRHYQDQLGSPVGASTRPGDWYGAVALYSGATDTATAQRFADDVFATLVSGESRTTIDGQRVSLVGNPAVQPRREQLAQLGLRANRGDAKTQCPKDLGCEWIPAPYEWYGKPNPYAYGNHDLATRPDTMDIDYIIIHDTETSYEGTLRLVQNPRYVSWQYSLRSSDGHIAQHVKAKDVAWHAGNWYVNMHSIGLEHEGWAGQNGEWYTEAMYRTSARLVAYLADRYDIPLDRAHIIGHDQIPGITPAFVAGMHWDPGPFWDWEHYFDLLGAPLDGDEVAASAARTVIPGYEGNPQPITGCTTGGDAQESAPCDDDHANFVYLRQEPSHDAPLVTDVGLKPDGTPSTTYVSDIGARAAAGHEFVVANRQGDWTGVWYLGAIAWFYDPTGDRNSVPTDAMTVQPGPGLQTVPVYGRAYPERSAYPAEIPYQTVTPLQYTIKAGQSYVVGDANIETDYYYATTFGCEYVAADCTQVVGQDRYYEIWFGHRMAYVRAVDVVLTPVG